MNYGEKARFDRQWRADPDGCHLWVGPMGRDGYGKTRPRPGAKEQPAHVAAFEHYHGPVPPGMQVDHACHTLAVHAGTCRGGPCKHRRCVNPAHLEAVTAAENTARQDHAHRRKTHCKMGHEYTEANTIRRQGRRWCRTCEARRKR